MKVKLRIGLFAVMALSLASAFAERQALERYNTVIERQMFGPVPPGFDPTKPASAVSAKEERAKEQQLSKEQEQLKSAIHFSMINVAPDGSTAVGFSDQSDKKSPKHYYLKVGEQRDGWLVKEADPIAAKMTIVKGEVEVSLELGGNSASGGGTRRAGAVAQQAPQRRGASYSGGFGPNSLRERRMRRSQRAEEEKAAAAEKAAQEKAEHEAREAEREAERVEREKAEKAEREAERAEMQKKLAEMAEEIRRNREAAAEKEKVKEAPEEE